MKRLAKDPNQRYQARGGLVEGLRVSGMMGGGSGVWRASAAPGSSPNSSPSGQFSAPASMFGVPVKDDTQAIDIDLEESFFKSKKFIVGAVIALSLVIGF